MSARLHKSEQGLASWGNMASYRRATGRITLADFPSLMQTVSHLGTRPILDFCFSDSMIQIKANRPPFTSCSQPNLRMANGNGNGNGNLKRFKFKESVKIPGFCSSLDYAHFHVNIARSS